MCPGMIYLGQKIGANPDHGKKEEKKEYGQDGVFWGENTML